MKKDPRSQIQEVLGDNLIACICEGALKIPISVCFWRIML